ncbi:hypothetical protein C6P77_03870 [Burkholderia ambifaria]|nr:hypothetical protein C6P77_03870 [Burkholderia ambifaria]
MLPASAGSGAARLGVPGVVLLCRQPFVEPPGWGLRSSHGGDARLLSAGPPARPPTVVLARIAVAPHENPASV